MCGRSINARRVVVVVVSRIDCSRDERRTNHQSFAGGMEDVRRRATTTVIIAPSRRTHTHAPTGLSRQESLALASMARDGPPASSTASCTAPANSTAAAVRGKVGSEFET